MGGDCVYERLCIMIGELLTRTMSALVLLVCFFWAYLHSALLFSMLLGASLFIIVCFEWSELLETASHIRFFFITLMYPILPMLGLILLTQWYRHLDLLFPLYPFIISWIYDTMGYLVGITIGNHKIWPSISPGKSWEGLAGSLVGVFIGNLFMLQKISIEPFYTITKRFSTMFTFSVVITLAAFFGGMMISALKRRRGLKDTGSLLPGHGGLLDRFDSILFVGVVVWVVLIGESFFR